MKPNGLCFALVFVTLTALIAVEAQHSHGKLSAKEEIEQIRELARMIRQTENPSELTVQNLLLWLQGKYDSQTFGTRKARQQQQQPSREYLPAVAQNSNANVVGRPRPFQRPQPQHQTVKPINVQGPYPQPSDQPNYEPYPESGTTPKPEFSYPTRPKPRPKPTTTAEPPFTGYPAETSPKPEAGYVEEESGKQSEQNAIEGQESGSEQDNHPPHIHAIDVQCAKDMMTITIEFNRVFNGVIYSKGFYNSEKCRYVTENSGKEKYTFTVSLDSCGTQFVDQFAQGGQAYLENVLVLQNEPGIQEVWDTVRTVRCLWEGSIKQDVSVSLVIGMLAQEVVTFNGDTGKARLDIQVGKGPFAPPANGLVKIGETMTLVVYVEGDTGFDVLVRRCQARDAAGENSIQLFDDRGCVLKPKLFGAFQKTKETGNSGASIIAYAYFSAFKFPDEMDLIIECNVELCKTDCEMCPENQKFEPGKRKRRDLSFNETVLDLSNKVSSRLRVVSPDDIADLNTRGQLNAFTIDNRNKELCLSTQGFLLTSLLVLTLLMTLFITSTILWLKLQKKSLYKV